MSNRDWKVYITQTRRVLVRVNSADQTDAVQDAIGIVAAEDIANVRVLSVQYNERDAEVEEDV